MIPTDPGYYQRNNNQQYSNNGGSNNQYVNQPPYNINNPRNDTSKIVNKKQHLIVEMQKSKIEKLTNFLRFTFRAFLVFITAYFIFGSFAQKTEFIGHNFHVRFIDWYDSPVIPMDLEKPNIAIIPVFGIIASQRSGLFDFSPSEIIIQMLNKAEKDEQIRAVILKIDSPGGTVFDSEKIATKIKQVKKRKKIYALLENQAASGGYLIASYADKIFAYKETITGSIGVIMELPNVKKLMDKAGIEIRSITSGKMKSMGSPFKEFNEKDLNIFQNIVDETHKRFIKEVSNNRELPLKEVQRIADGRILTGSQALTLKLIDSADGLDGLLKELERENLKNTNLIKFSTKTSPFFHFTEFLNKISNYLRPQEKSSMRLFFK